MGETSPVKSNAGSSVAAFENSGGINPHIEKMGDTSLDNYLNTFFKNSPWRVGTKKLMGKEWYVWQRVEGGKPQQPIIFLAPVSKEAPFIYRTPLGSSDLFMIKVSESVFGYIIDDSNMLRPIESKNRCEFPTYIVIPKEPKLVNRGIQWTTKKDGESIKYHYDVDRTDLSSLDAYITVDGYRGILYGVEVSCLNPPPAIEVEVELPDPLPPPSDDVDVEVEVESVEEMKITPFPHDAQGDTCLIYDGSGSAGRFNIDFYNERASNVVANQVAKFLSKNIDMLNYYYKEYSAEEVDGELRKIKLSFRIYFINENETARRDVQVQFDEVVDFDSLRTYMGMYDDYSWNDSDEGEKIGTLMTFDPNSLVKEDAVKEIVRSHVETILSSVNFFVDNDNSQEVANIFEQCAKKGSAILFTDEAAGLSVAPPAILTKLKVGKFLPPPVKTPTEIATKRVSTAFDEVIPLFISIALDDSPLKMELLSEGFKAALKSIKSEKDAITIVQEKSPKEMDLFVAIGKLSNLVKTKRTALYRKLIEIAQDKRYDVHVTKRAISLIALWAIKGDSSAKEILFKSILDVNKFPSMVEHIFLAKSVSLFMDDKHAEDLLKKITSDPEARENYIYLMALSSNKRFVNALQFILDHIWTYRIVENDYMTNLMVALVVLFSDPVVEYEYPEDIKDKVLETLAGGGFTPERLQEAFETFAADILPALAGQTAPAAAMMSTFAIKLLQPEWKEKKVVTLNPIPRERHFYHLPQSAFEKNIGRLVKNAKWEEGWIAFYTYDKSFEAETGVLSSQGSAIVNVDWDFVGREVADIIKETEEGAESLTVVDYHIHPWHDTAFPLKMSALPSSTDFLTWIGKLCEIKRRYPDATVEFKVSSPLGITTLKPNPALINIVEAMVKADADRVGHIPAGYGMAVMEYEAYINKHLDTARTYAMPMRAFFDIEVPRGAH